MARCESRRHFWHSRMRVTLVLVDGSCVVCNKHLGMSDGKERRSPHGRASLCRIETLRSGAAGTLL